MDKMKADMVTRDDRWTRDDKDPYDDDAEVHEDVRFPEQGEYDERKDTLMKAGIKVHTHVKWSHLMHPPSLMIYVDDLPAHEQPEASVQDQAVLDRFKVRHSRWTSEATTNPAVHRHITIVNADEIKTVDDWWHKVYYLYTKFDDKDLWLYPNFISKGSCLYLDPEKDPIASDPVVQELHSKNLKWNRQPDGSYLSRLDGLHVSM